MIRRFPTFEALSQAAAWYRKAAEQGHVEAQAALGVMYATGDGVGEDHTEAAAWFRKAADQGHPDAQMFLGAAYVTGRGVPQDDAQGVAWFARAAEQGYAGAQFNLALMYADGRGVGPDLVEAYKWLDVAASITTGDEFAQYSRVRDMVGGRLTMDQLTDALRRSRAWLDAFQTR